MNAAVCEMEGCRRNGGCVCANCGSRLRCLCGRFVREDETEHYKTCEVVDDYVNGGCPICEGGMGTACWSHFL